MGWDDSRDTSVAGLDDSIAGLDDSIAELDDSMGGWDESGSEAVLRSYSSKPKAELSTDCRGSAPLLGFSKPKTSLKCFKH